MNKKLYLFFMCLIGLVASTFVSCDSEDLDNDTSRANYELVLQQIVTPEGKSRFPTANSNEVVLVGCEKGDIAEGLVSALILRKYQGEASVELDLKEYGMVSVTRIDPTSGKYFRVELDIKNQDKLRLLFVSMDYFNIISDKENDGEIGITFGQGYRCTECGACYTYVPDSCLNCGMEVNVPLLSIIPIPSLSVDEVDVNFNMEVDNN